MINRKLAVLGALAATCLAGAASAQTVVLDFEGVNDDYPFSVTTIEEFYNGGVSGDGQSGTNYGVSFTDSAYAICLNTAGVSCSNTSRGGLGDPSSQRSALIFLGQDETFLNYSAGFETGFSFNYTAPFFPGSVSVFDGLDGTGTLLATLSLSQTVERDCDTTISGGAAYCPFVAAGVTFSGIARSISFAGTANYIAFDDVTFGSAIPGGSVPEPATWAMMIGGFGLAGGALRKRRSGTLATA